MGMLSDLSTKEHKKVKTVIIKVWVGYEFGITGLIPFNLTFFRKSPH